MPLDDPCLAEHILSALIIHLIRTGAVEPQALLGLDMSAEARHHLKALIVEASAPPEPRLRVVPDGGKPRT